MEKAINIVNEWIALNDPDKVLDLCYLQLTELPNIPSNCQILCCNFNELITLPPLPNCQELYCDNNKLEILPLLPNCEILYCHNNMLTTLPALPNCIRLNCQSNQLTNLPELINCQNLFCSDNKLTNLPTLPNCHRLDCEHNQLTTLPELLNCETLYCYNNLLVSLPPLLNCEILKCQRNQLTSLPRLPEFPFQKFYKSFDCSENKYLHITKKQAKQLALFELDETPNYNKHCKVIQRNYRNYMRKRYCDAVSQYLFKGPAKLICLYTI